MVLFIGRRTYFISDSPEDLDDIVVDDLPAELIKLKKIAGSLIQFVINYFSHNTEMLNYSRMIMPKKAFKILSGL